MTEPELLAEQRDGVGYLHLNRPRAINALTVAMFTGIRAALGAWAEDASVERVELSGAGDRGLCAGADVRALREQILAGGDPAAPLAEEYAMDAAVAAFPKPYTAHMRGFTMGGGLGVSAHGTRRLVYPDSALAMPETIIGFVPDVGMMWLLARAPGELGTHLALTGATINAADAVLVGWADEVVGPPPASSLVADRSWIDICYAGDDPVAVVHRLEQHADPRAREAGALIRQRSPFAVAVALEALRRARALATVADVLDQDLTLARALLPRPDFAEGVRAQLVDKDRRPRWRPGRLEEVDRGAVLACFG
ncbi:MAG: enoyl-CoA hydratase/isomerase family protein [Propioniciclava sp.]